MKLSISLPENIAREIRELAKESERSTSWWIQRAWTIARTQLRNPDEYQKAKKSAMSKLDSLEGVLKSSFPKETSVGLAQKAFKKKS